MRAVLVLCSVCEMESGLSSPIPIRPASRLLPHLLRTTFACAATVSVFALAGCLGGKAKGVHPVNTGGGDAARGQLAINQYGCGKCHTIPGIRGAHGVVGPPLAKLGERTIIGGNFPNTPSTLARWVHSPTSMKPKTAMPDLGLTEQQSRDVAAYLETLR